MPNNSVDLVLPGDPLLISYREPEPVPSRYTGKMLRRLELTIGGRDDDMNEQLEAALTATGDGDALVSDNAGGRWKVTSHGYSYQAGQASTTYIHNVEFVEHEELNLERVEFDGLTLIPDRWSLEPQGETDVLTVLVTMDTEAHQRLERVLEYRETNEDVETYFPVKWVGISENPVSMRFGKCLWQSLDSGGARHLVVLVSEQGDDDKGVGLLFMEPERTRLMQQTALIKTRQDALIEELRQAGVLDAEAVERLTREITRVPFSPMREFSRVHDIDLFFR